MPRRPTLADTLAEIEQGLVPRALAAPTLPPGTTLAKLAEALRDAPPEPLTYDVLRARLPVVDPGPPPPASAPRLAKLAHALRVEAAREDRRLLARADDALLAAEALTLLRDAR